MWKCPAVVLVLVLASGAVAWGNPGHEVTIAELSAQITQTPELPELFFQRAWNFREIGRFPDARADWEKTLALNPGFLPASRELARTDAAEGQPEAGIARLRKAMASAPADQAFHLPGCHSVIAELLLKQGRPADALREAQAGLDRAPDFQLDLCLLRSEAQRRLGRLEERVADLAAAMTKLRSFVVRMKWFDAMIDAGHGKEILPEIEQEIGNTRYQASWLIRRARIRLKSGEGDGAAADLEGALAEIGSRLRPGSPDLSLICDRGLVHALQGNHAAALADLELARKSGADFWLLMPLEAMVEMVPPVPSGDPAKVLVPSPSPEPVRNGNEK